MKPGPRELEARALREARFAARPKGKVGAASKALVPVRRAPALDAEFDPVDEALPVVTPPTGGTHVPSAGTAVPPGTVICATCGGTGHVAIGDEALRKRAYRERKAKGGRK